ncbi:MAG TPA: hypothetical protein VER78_07805, partial [Thermoanaerobaculia bacterium]|nr:hypothetical protein [Thermoanaerobaculia bacterium]
MRCAGVAAAGILVAAFAPGAAPKTSPSPVPTPAAAESPGQAMLEQEEAALAGRSYTYDPAGRRDPFRS